jgi:UPF0176 protein
MQSTRQTMKTLHNRVNRQLLKQRFLESDEKRSTLSFYRYLHIESPRQFRDTLYRLFDEMTVYGRIYVAEEGINGQISLPTDKMELFQSKLYSIPQLDGMRLNLAVDDDGRSFYKLTIKVREKIVADGLDDKSFDVTKRGQHLSADEFNELTEREDTIVVDMRNHYESEVGHFEGAICPDVTTFREALPRVVDMLKDKRDKPVVMYCTGGIRCEKASAYLKHQGFKDVYQLDGGIIEYTRQASMKGLPNKFLGKNFVFDDRLGERITPEVIARCHQCGTPCDTHVNCANDACHILFIQCPECAQTYDQCCSATCRDFTKLPEKERKARAATLTFNGQRHAKSKPGLLDLS